MKRKRIIKIVAIIMAVLLLASLGFTIIATLISSVGASNELDELNERKKKNQEERDALETERSQLANEKASLMTVSACWAA